MAATEPTPSTTARARRIRLATSLIALGLLVEAFTLQPARPWAFLGFVLLGCALVGAGVLIYLHAVITR